MAVKEPNALKGGEDWVENTLLREAVEQTVREGTNLSAICRRLGWLRPDGTSETSKLQRKLGMRQHEARGKKWFGREMKYDSAVEICRAIERDPVDFDL